MSPLAEPQLTEGMEKLVGSELIFRRASAPDPTYLFKHALVKDAAYESLLKSKRLQLHAQIANVLEKEFAGVLVRPPRYWPMTYRASVHERASRTGFGPGTWPSARVAPETWPFGLECTSTPRASADAASGLDIRMLLGTAYLPRSQRLNRLSTGTTSAPSSIGRMRSWSRFSSTSGCTTRRG